MDPHEHARKLKEKNPNAQVMTVEHDFVNEPWEVKRLHTAFEKVAQRIFNDFPPDTSDFVVRKKLLDDPEILALQRQHPRLYWTLTDRRLMADEHYRSVLRAMLKVRRQVETGQIPNNQKSDVAATNEIVAALLQKQEGTGSGGDADHQSASATEITEE